MAGRSELVDHIHYIVWAYSEKQNTPDGYRYIDYVEVDTIALTASEALERAEELVPKTILGRWPGEQGYKISRVYEHLPGQCTGGHPV